VLERVGHRISSRPPDLDIPLVPVSYAARFVALLAPRGFSAVQVLAGTGYRSEQLDDPNARMPVAAVAQMVRNGVALTDDESLGLQLGLSLKASSHGWLGFALITCNSLRDAILLGERYMEVRASPWRIRLIVEGDTAIMRFVELVPVGAVRTVVLEAVLGAVIRLGEFMLGERFTHPAIEFWSESPEPAHHRRFRDQVPRARYNCATNEARFPTRWLDRPLALREPVANREAVSALENERKLIDPGADLLARTRALLSNPANQFPDLECVASRLMVSSRTLRRHLRHSGTTFHALRDELRRGHAITLLEQSQLAVDEIARALGYSDGAGFVRAFQRWTGATPSHHRKRTRQPPAT
jgi:AraC-like DNA-binding protein